MPVSPTGRLPLAREGYPHIGIAALLWLFLSLVLHGAGFVAGALLFTLVVNFFRDPERTPPADPDTILAPADGRVIQVAEVQDERFFGRKALRVSIFMSPLDVHVNRVPTGGTVAEVRYHAGKYLRAFADKASLDNEQNAVSIRTDTGHTLWCVQIAGFIARRIVCYLRAGDRVQRGQRYGMILFGSRADVYLLPEEVEVQVRVGDKARAGETVLARWR